MSAPETIKEARKRLVDECSYSDPHGMLLIDPWAAAKAVFDWRTEWLRDAEPQLRPVSEKPERGGVICEVYPGAMGCENRYATPFRWRGDCHLAIECIGWILLERAKPKTIAEEARELLNTVPVIDGGPGSVAWAARTTRLLERVADRGAPPPKPRSSEIKRMVDRFLQWPLPPNFSPDYGINVDKSVCRLGEANGPNGTNLLDAEQAEAMVRFMVSAEEKRDE